MVKCMEIILFALEFYLKQTNLLYGKFSKLIIENDKFVDISHG